MKITSVEIHPEGSSAIAILSFRDPQSRNVYNIKGITGLDAASIVPKFYTGPGSSSFYNMSLEGRDLVFSIGLNPDYEVYKSNSELRDDLYRMIASSRTGKIQVQFKNGSDVVAAISGFMSKFEAPLFDKQQTVIITITCTDAMLRALEPVMLFKDIAISRDDTTVIVRDLSS